MSYPCLHLKSALIPVRPINPNRIKILGLTTLAKTIEKVAEGVIKDAKKRYSAGVLKHRQMGYWDADYVPYATDRPQTERSTR